MFRGRDTNNSRDKNHSALRRRPLPQGCVFALRAQRRVGRVPSLRKRVQGAQYEALALPPIHELLHPKDEEAPQQNETQVCGFGRGGENVFHSCDL